MNVVLVVENPNSWPSEFAGADVVSAREYLTNARFVERKRLRVFNLCRTYGYQTLGYYVSLLAEARGHKPMPSVTTARDLGQDAMIRIASEDLEELIQKALTPLSSNRFYLSVYFGRNLAARYERLAQVLFNRFPVPLLRAEFIRSDDRWRLESVKPIALNDVPESHFPFVIEQTERFFARPRAVGEASHQHRYHMAILFNPDEIDGPSNERGIQKFIKAAKKYDIGAWVVGKRDIGRIAEYDALFIRETTSVEHHTYRFARRAAAEGLVVIDDPESIVRCTNKVYQAELFLKHGIACPRTMVVHRENRDEIEKKLGLPCVLKQPDSAFSAGVHMAKDSAELRSLLDALFKTSDLLIAQKVVKTAYDWRIGVLDGKAFYVCRYHMAKGHWQIQKAGDGATRSYGKVECVPLEATPRGAVDLAERASRLIGNGLYGVDIKETENGFLVIEINDNPNISAGDEDQLLKDSIYDTVMRSFHARLEQRGRIGGER